MKMPYLFQTLYKRRITELGYLEDNAQLHLVIELAQLHHRLFQQHQQNTPKPSQGLYIWGPVGRGKTFLMDLFFESIPDDSGLRLHFHRFMARTHRQLTAKQGEKDPLKLIAKELAEQYKIICFDEFYLNDIADAMILGSLLQELFNLGVILISTSNRQPDELYREDLYRDRVTPIIKRIEQAMLVVNLDGHRDHRFREQPRQTCFFENNPDRLQQQFFDIAPDNHCHLPVSIKGREIPVKLKAEHCIWFSFSDLCEGPRSQLDYIELASRYSTVMLSDIPALSGQTGEQIKARGTEDGSVAVAAGERQVILAKMDDPTRRFISLVDELYDRCVNLFLSTEVPLDQLYIEGSLTFEFARTISRLTEMQSEEYQARPHLP